MFRRVFAFAVTLLVLGIALPAFKRPPNVVAYALSFSVIGMMWQNHHAIFRLVDRVDRKTVALNFLLLAGTVLIPFATSTLGAYPTMHSSTFLYGIVLTYTATIYNLLLAYLIRKRAFLYALSTLLALWMPLASFAAYVLVAVYYLVPRGVDADIAAE